MRTQTHTHYTNARVHTHARSHSNTHIEEDIVLRGSEAASTRADNVTKKSVNKALRGWEVFLEAVTMGSDLDDV